MHGKKAQAGIFTVIIAVFIAFVVTMGLRGAAFVNLLNFELEAYRIETMERGFTGTRAILLSSYNIGLKTFTVQELTNLALLEDKKDGLIKIDGRDINVTKIWEDKLNKLFPEKNYNFYVYYKRQKYMELRPKPLGEKTKLSEFIIPTTTADKTASVHIITWISK